MVYATALEIAARKRLEPAKKTLLEVALGITRMTLLDRVRNVLGLAARHEQGRWWPAAVMTLLVLPAVWFASMAATSAEDGKPAGGSEKLGVQAGTRAKNTATAFFMISMQENSLICGGTIQVDRDRFDIYKNTHAELLRSRLVLRAALRKPDVAKLPWVKDRKASGDLERWLGDHLEVTFPAKAEIMKVSLRTHDDSADAVVLLNAVADAYMSEVVNAEQDRKRRRLEELERACGDKEQQVRQKREELKGLVASAGGADPETRKTRQNLLLEELALHRQEIAKAESDLRRYQLDLAVQKAVTVHGLIRCDRTRRM